MKTVEIVNINSNRNIPKTSLYLSELVKNGYNIDEIMASLNGLNEEHVIKFLSDNFNDPDVNMFLTSYYDKYRIDDNKVLVISDTHLGGIYGNYQSLYSVYNFAINNGIKYILHAGDIIEGYCSSDNRNPRVIEQVLELKEKYPSIDDIKTYYILGNHDYLWYDDRIYHTNCDFLYVKNTLKEVKNLLYTGVLKTYINFYGEHRIMLFHTSGYQLRHPNLECDLILQGHGHGYWIEENNNTVHLPCLCNDTYGRTINQGFIVLSLLDNCYKIDKYKCINNDWFKEDTKKLVYKK